jgi:hypothetical protein
MPLYQVAPIILEELLKLQRGQMPNGVLLERIESDINFRGRRIAFHFRKSSNDLRRNSKIDDVLLDLKIIASEFPNSTVTVFSNEEGLDYLWKTLFVSTHVEGVIIVKQTSRNFVDAIQEVLSHDIYFQRRGGGMAVAAIFSNMPYLILESDDTYFFGRNNYSLLSFANENQRFYSVFPSRRKIGRILGEYLS